MAKKTKKAPNFWDQHHRILDDADKVLIREKIENKCEWSTDTFYRKKRNHKLLKTIEKQIVVKQYGVTMEDFFPVNNPVLTN